MSFYLEPFVVDKARLQELGLDTSANQDDLASLNGFRMSVAPPGVHDLRECTRFEQEWRANLPAVIEVMLDRGETCLLYANGPMYMDGLPQIVPYIVGPSDRVGLFHVPSVTWAEDNGYICSWIGFEYERERFTGMMRDTKLDFEETHLCGLMTRRECAPEVIVEPLWRIPIRWVIEKKAIVFTPEPHFEGLLATGERARVQVAIHNIERSFADRLSASPSS